MLQKGEKHLRSIWITLVHLSLFEGSAPHLQITVQLNLQDWDQIYTSIKFDFFIENYAITLPSFH